jgi:hypothetical protein
VAKIKLRQLAMQMLLGAMLVSTAHAALENREVAFNGIGRDGGRTIAAGVFVL